MQRTYLALLLTLHNVCVTDRARLSTTGSLPGLDMDTAGSMEAADAAPAVATALTINLLGTCTVTAAALAAPRRPGWLSAAEDASSRNAM